MSLISTVVQELHLNEAHPSHPRTEHRLSDAWIDFACVPLSFSHRTHLRESADTPDMALRSRQPFLSLTSIDFTGLLLKRPFHLTRSEKRQSRNLRCRHSERSHQRAGVAVPDGASQVCAHAATGYALTGVWSYNGEVCTTADSFAGL